MNVLINRITKRLLAVAICMLVLSSSIIPCYAADNATQTVKVGFFAYDGYYEIDDNGIRSGYGYEILQHLAGYAGLRYEYVGYDKSWSEMLTMLENGEVDILGTAQKTPERIERFAFTDKPIGTSNAILTVKAGDDRYLIEEMADWNGIRVGMRTGSSRNDSFIGYAAENGFTYTTVYYEDTAQMEEDLQAGVNIDAILTSSLRQTENEWVIAEYGASSFYLMLNKSNTELLSRLNEAIDRMDAYEPGVRTKLTTKYYSAENDKIINFSREELEYIEQMQGQTITALLNPDRAPYSWVENDAFCGILYDCAIAMIERTGLNIDFIDVSSREEYEDIISSGSVDIRFDSEYNLWQADYDDFWLTPAYVTVPVGRLYLNDTTTFKTAAVPSNSDMMNSYSQKLVQSGFELTYYSSIEEIIDAIMSGSQDVAFLAMDSATMAVRDDITNRLVVEEVYGDEISYCIAVNRNQNRLLYSIISKAAASLGDSEIDAIRQEYSENLEKPFSIIGYFYDYPLRVFLGVAIILSIAILIIVLVTQIKRRKDEFAHAKKEHEQNELLKDALAAAEKAGAAKTQFLSRMSHEMRTPLNAIIGFIELAKDADAEQMENYLASSDIAAKQLLNVINDVLDMSSIESGKLKIGNSPFNFRRLISSITNIYGTQCRQKGITFETKIITPTEDWIIGDELRVNQILMNLLGNAVKFTSAGHVWLTISETTVENYKVFLRFVVSDTGCGMSAEMQERLFKPFEQESTETAKKYGGNGLGLSIVKNLVGMMDGTIKVVSVPGEGSAFTVDLPFTRSNVEQQTALPGKANDLRILAVDDEKAERDYIDTVLSRMGVNFTCVESGGNALIELDCADKAGNPYNVCLVDWRMPGMDGLDTTEMIRKKYGHDVIVIVVSAYDFQQAGESAKEAGANLFISKPIFQSSLFDLLMTLTGGEIAKVREEPKLWDFAGRRVLLAEDNTLNQIVAKGYLAKFNVVVDVAEDGKQAAEKFLASKPGYYDAILMDIQMPNMDGFEATKAIRESNHPEAKTIQIIAQTADAFNEDIAKALSVGMNGHVAKPIKPDVLAKALFTAFEANDKNKRG